jgi:hypothetical protein
MIQRRRNRGPAELRIMAVAEGFEADENNP